MCVKSHNGFYLLFESTLATILAFIVILSAKTSVDDGLDQIIVLQKAHDLLLIWSKERDFSKDTLEKDFKTSFPGKSGIIEVDEALPIIINKGSKSQKSK